MQGTLSLHRYLLRHRLQHKDFALPRRDCLNPSKSAYAYCSYATMPVERGTESDADGTEKESSLKQDGHPKSKPESKRPPLTHFLCIPLLTPTSTPQLRETLSRFQESLSAPVKQITPPPGSGSTTASSRLPVIPEKAFRPLGVLHLTLGVMSLRNGEQLEAAKGFLASLDLTEILATSVQAPNTVESSTSSVDHNKSLVSEGEAPGFLETLKRAVTPPSLTRPSMAQQPLTISLQGLQGFPKDRKATVLHCPPHDPTSRLYPFCVKLRQEFVNAGFMQPETRKLVLHATIVNTVYAKKKREGEKRRMGSISFDATELLRVFNEDGGVADGDAVGEYIWADEILVDHVAICEMSAKRVEDRSLGQAYTVVAKKMI